MTFEIARRLVKRGDTVEWFSAAFPGALKEETLDGVAIVRAGRQWTVHWSAFRRYRCNISKRFDIVVDEVNTIPFFTPLWSKVPTVMFIHQLAREVWWYESPFPLSALGFVAEPLYLRLYRKVPVLTVSASTRDDLSRLGFIGPITIIPEGIEPVAHRAAGKQSEAKFLYVGRIAPSKRIDHILKALALFRSETGTGTLSLVGSGSKSYQRSLIRLTQQLGIVDSVQLLGRVSLSEKQRLMASAYSLLVTSVREGWGLVVSEANACGTPAIVYDVPGLRDSVVHESTGLIVTPRPDSLARAMVRLTKDPYLYARLAREAQLWSSTLSFDETARIAGSAISQALAA